MREIRKEIVIDAPAARVWKHLTDSALLAGWLMSTDFKAEPGSAYRMDCGTEGEITGVVREAVPHQKLVYSWTSKHLGIETLVTFTLVEEKGRTRLTLVHTGWDALPPEGRSKADLFEHGWGEHLASLQARAVRD